MVDKSDLNRLKAERDAARSLHADLVGVKVEERIKEHVRRIRQLEHEEDNLGFNINPTKADAITSEKLLRRDQLNGLEAIRDRQGAQVPAAEDAKKRTQDILEQHVRAYFKETSPPAQRKADEHIDAFFRVQKGEYGRAAALSEEYEVGVPGPEEQWQAGNELEKALGRTPRRSPRVVASDERKAKKKAARLKVGAV